MSVIYVLKNPRNADVSKVGESGVGGHTRTAYQGVDWELFKEFPVSPQRRKGIEKIILRELKSANVNIGLEGPREIFTIRPEDAVRRVEDIIRRTLSKIEGGIRDADYWNYLATDAEIAERNKRTAEEFRRKEKAQQRRKEEQERREELLEIDRKRMDQYMWLLTHYNSAREGLSFFVLGIFSMYLLIPVGLVLGVLVKVFDIEPIKGDSFLFYLILITVGLASIFYAHTSSKDKKTTSDELIEFQKENLINCSECNVHLFRSLTRAAEDNSPAYCPECDGERRASEKLDEDSLIEMSKFV